MKFRVDLRPCFNFSELLVISYLGASQPLQGVRRQCLYPWPERKVFVFVLKIKLWVIVKFDQLSPSACFVFVLYLYFCTFVFLNCHLAQGDPCFPNRFYQRLQLTYICQINTNLLRFSLKLSLNKHLLAVPFASPDWEIMMSVFLQPLFVCCIFVVVDIICHLGQGSVGNVASN